MTLMQIGIVALVLIVLSSLAISVDFDALAVQTAGALLPLWDFVSALLPLS